MNRIKYKITLTAQEYQFLYGLLADFIETTQHSGSAADAHAIKEKLVEAMQS